MKLLNRLLCFCIIAASLAEEFDGNLPNSTHPEAYIVFITTDVPAATDRFTGNVYIEGKVVVSTNEIFLHSRGHTFDLFALNVNGESFDGVSIERVNEEVIKVVSPIELPGSASFMLQINYEGSLSLTSEGLFRSDYFTKESEVYTRHTATATNFQPFNARHAFPCYDTTLDQHRAKFTIMITHDETSNSISNTDEIQRMPETGGQVSTQFDDTPSILPSSLAFFVSGLSIKMREIRGVIKHFVSARESEMEYTEKLFELTETILISVESYMGVQLPNGVLHSVALPNCWSDVSTFYDFNYYQEELILFDPSVSSTLKKFSMRKLITRGIVSQFIGNLVSFESPSDAWIFKGLTKLFEYQFSADDEEELPTTELFISEVLHPTLVKSFSSEFPISADEALTEELAEKAACIFRMIYYAIESEVFQPTLQLVLHENLFKSISSETFYEALQSSYDEHSRHEVDLRAVIEGFVSAGEELIINARGQGGNFLIVSKAAGKDFPIPYNWKTSSMEEPTEVEWLPSDAYVSTLILPSFDWFLFNVDQFAFYRVNYDVTNWRALINVLKANPEAFSAASTAQLIDDAFNLAESGLLSYDIAFDLVMTLTEDSSYLAWSTAMENLLQLNSRISQFDIHHRFQRVSLELSASYMNHMGFDDLPHEDKAMDVRARVQLIDFVCRMKSEACLNHMHSQLNSHIVDKEKLPVNLESSIFCYGLMASALSGEGPRLAEALWREMQASGNMEYRLRIIKSLGCYGDVDALLKLLRTILDLTEEAQYFGSESFEVIQSVYSNTAEGVEATMNFMIEFTEDAVKRSEKANLVEILLDNLSKRIHNEMLFSKFKAMLEALVVAPEISKRHVDVIEENLAWQSSEAANEVYLRFRVTEESTTSPEPLPTTDPTTEQPSTTTASSTNLALSVILGTSCALVRLLL